MASIFEELMNVNSELTESVRPSSARRTSRKMTEHKKISVKNIRVESRKIFEDTDYDELDQEFANEPTEESPDEVVLVIDPEISSDEEAPEDAASNMVGDMVYKCPVCGSNYVCSCNSSVSEGIEVDEEGVPTECPICGDDAEQILVGEISPADNAGKETEPDLLDNDDNEDLESGDESLEDDSDEEEYEEESLSELFGKNKKSKDDWTVGFRDENGKFKGVSYHDSKESAIKDRDQLQKDNPDIKYVVVSGNKRDESLSEDFDEDSIETSEGSGERSALELEIPDESSSPAVEVNNSTVTLMLDDSRFESLMNSVIKENYKGNPKFKILRCSVSQGKLRLEYIVREGKRSTTGTLIGEGFDKNSRRSTIKFVDKGAFTESFAKTPSFVVECVRVRNAVTPLSIKYNYKVKVNESLYRVSGKVGK